MSTESKWMTFISTWGIVIVIALQIGMYSLRLTDPWVDGRFHTNWGPPFWLLNAIEMHKTNFFESYLGVVREVENGKAIGWYSSHPQFIAIPLYVWTKLFGFSEWVPRTLAGLTTLLTTFVLWRAFRIRHTAQQTFLVLLFWALTPLMVVYGSKLDQEPFVMLALALALLGYERFVTAKEKFPWTWSASIAFMMWCDWSGFVFAGLFFIAFILLARRHQPSRTLAAATVGGGVLGSVIVFLQTALELRVFHTALENFTGLYKYRSNSTSANFWYIWIQRQLNFAWLNFSICLIGAVFYLYIAKESIMRRRAILLVHGYELMHLAGVIGIGTFIYALIVPQASYVHLYYQYFYGLPVAIGCMMVAEIFIAYAQRRKLNPLVPYTVIALACGFLVLGHEFNVCGYAARMGNAGGN